MYLPYVICFIIVALMYIYVVKHNGRKIINLEMFGNEKQVINVKFTDY